MEKKKGGLKKSGVWLAVMFFFIIELFFYAWCRVQYTNNSYNLSRILGSQNQLLQLQKSLTIELARLQSPQRLTEMAHGRLNLVIPTPDQMVSIP
ncbi:MAG: cell division protein FtsL [Deltaproteobacteria bacterium]|nr:cell division protein FtsL [Deltaproteobacteria bacterium]